MAEEQDGAGVTRVQVAAVRPAPENGQTPGVTNMPRSGAPTLDRAAPAAPFVMPAPGATLLNGTYRIEQRLAEGGMGVVYRATNTITSAATAIKIVRPELVEDKFLQELFSREAAALRTVRDEAVVGYEGVFRDEHGRVFLAMEYVDGPSLGDLMRQRPLSVDEVLALQTRLVGGLAAAHAVGVFHRDLSPDNVLFRGGQLSDAVLIDFGIAKRQGGNERTLYGPDQQSFTGKYAYASPEQAGLFPGPVDGRSDIYSLALLLAAAALGRPLPMGHDPVSAVAARMRVPDLGALPPILQDRLRPLLEPDPTRRPQRIANILVPPRSAPVPAGPATTPPARTASNAAAAKEAGRRGPNLVLLGGGLAGLAAVGMVTYLLWPTEPPLPVLPGASSPPVAVDDGQGANRPSPTTPGLIEVLKPATTPGEPLPGTPAQVTPPPNEPTTNYANVQPTVPPAPGPLAPTGPDPTELGRTLRALAAAMPCARLEPQVAGGGLVTVTGTVAADRQLADLRNWAWTVAGVQDVQTRVQVLANPLCLTMAEISAALPPDAGPPPSLRLSRADGIYRADRDVFIATVGAPKTAAAYLYVDYVHENGDVAHLLPEPLHRANRAGAGQTIQVGHEDAGATAEDRVWRLGEPFGRAVIVVIASETPLYEGLREIEETVDSYLAFLRPALAQAAQRGSVSLTMTDIETRAGS